MLRPYKTICYNPPAAWIGLRPRRQEALLSPARLLTAGVCARTGISLVEGDSHVRHPSPR